MILLDTHIVAWLAFDPSRLSKDAVAAITLARAQGGVGISAVTLWELAMLATRKRIELTTSLESFLRQVEATFVVYPLSGKIAHTSVQFTDQYPADPMDRIIGATALTEGVSLVTRDEKIRKSTEVPCIW